MQEFKVGDVVVAIAGREMGEFFVVKEIIENYLLLIDGKARTFEKPKRKNAQHVKKINISAEHLTEKINDQKIVFDVEIRKYLKNISKGE